MTLKKLLLAVTALVGAMAFAQAPIGTVVNVNGVVTATQGATGMTVTAGTPIQNGMRFVTTSNGSVTLRLNNGCQVNVPPGHGVTVLQSMTCPQLVAAVQPVVPVAGPLAFPPSPDVVNTAVAVTAGIIGLLVLREVLDDDDEPLSPR